jgi:MFS family permease
MSLVDDLNKNFLKRFASRIKINRVIQFLTYSDILMLSGWGLVNPILAVFFTDKIIGGSVAIAGIASTIFFLTKSILQIPLARAIDAKKGEWDDFWIMVIGSLLISVSAFSFMFARYPWHIYVIQVVNGLGCALSYPGWLAIFTRHIDRNHESLEWSLYYTAIDLGSALTAALGGFIASAFGYQNLFALVGILSLLGTAFLMGVTGKLKGEELIRKEETV